MKIYNDAFNNIFLVINFDQKLKPLDDSMINKLPFVLDLRVISAVDQSTVTGIWIPYKSNRLRSLS